MGNRLTTLLASTFFLLAVSETDSQNLQIAIIDFYGLPQVSQTQARSALTVKEGDTIVIAVLRHSSDAEHRALAAQILAYAQIKRDVIDDLVYGLDDPSEGVRNDAMRALEAIAHAASAARQPTLHIPTEPFVGLLNSPIWTDRNKASLALANLSESRDPEILATLRNRAIGPLVEMARWKSEGHAVPTLVILGRIAGQSEEDVQAALMRGDREAVINAALRRLRRRR